ncbi:MAG: tRNA uridine-5-carboxymethylaminomethyl(34) synthesis enzyme MnmG [Candidatus Brocadiia bacterium]
MNVAASSNFDVIVVGAGHAGCEAACAAAGMGCRTLLLTISLDTIGWMSCNPAIGGIAKGQVVKEIDALGGIMAGVTDASAIQYRLLNSAKGPAVHSPRAQCDRDRYRIEMRKALSSKAGLTIHQAMVSDFFIEDGIVRGVRTAAGEIFRCCAVVLTTGTFLGGIIHIGELSYQGGRAGEPSAIGLTAAIERLGVSAGRLKTGTPPRVWGRSVDFDRTQRQGGDPEPCFFSFRTRSLALPQRDCHITRTNPATHDIIRRNFDRAPLYTGQIKSEGPRYCPSIEVKIVRFADKESHLLFLEPEGLESDEFYINGFSTSIPVDVQIEALQTVPGLENCSLSRPGYAIEYDYFDPLHLRATLESRAIPGVFFAGQINGTSGYEEAAGQGFVAGVNAAYRALAREDKFSLDRAQAYIGVMIDDLITQGASEPYRLFTSRAEHRLILRADNVYRRLAPLGYSLGLIPQAEYSAMETDWNMEDEITKLLAAHFVDGVNLLQHLRRPETMAREVVARHPKLAGMEIPDRILSRVEIDAKYSGYIDRANADIERLRKEEGQALPEDIDYPAIEELSFESRLKLAKVRPASIGQAGRVPGVTPADISVLLVRRKAGTLPRTRSR